MYMCTCILFCYRLLQDIEYSFLCCTVDPVVNIFYIQYCVSVNPQLLSPLVTISLFSMYVDLFLFFKISSFVPF